MSIPKRRPIPLVIRLLIPLTGAADPERGFARAALKPSWWKVRDSRQHYIDFSRSPGRRSRRNTAR